MTKASQFSEILLWIDSQKKRMVDLVIALSSINSHSDNLDGLQRMLEALVRAYAILHGKIEVLELAPRETISMEGKKVLLPPAPALRITKRQNASRKIFLSGHMDTVFPLLHPFQSVKQTGINTLQGPGVADMKGGLVIMLMALQALEKYIESSPSNDSIGWEILITPDEEVGSPGSFPLLVNAAKNNDFGLIFEPALADGALVSSRMGSANINVFVRGKSAHAGRDFDKGKNAILTLAEYILQVNKLCNADKGITINCGFISGGGPVNIVPDIALCKLNVRATLEEDFESVKKQIKEIAKDLPQNGIDISLQISQSRPPKPFTKNSCFLFNAFQTCAEEEGYPLISRPSGGVCDGNIVAAAGLPVLDTLGVVGDQLHTDKEAMEIDSLVQRSRLVALFLLKVATRTWSLDNGK